jgi:hypothetical protein
MTQAIRPEFISCARCGSEKKVGQRGPIPVFCSGACRAGNKNDRRIDIECTHCGQPASVRDGTRYCSSRCRNAGSYRAAREDGRYDAALAKSREATAHRQAANARPCPYCGDPMLNPRRVQCGEPDCKRAFQRDRVRKWHREYQAKNGQWYGAANYAEQQREYSRRRYREMPHWRERYPEVAALADARRRMLIQQADQGERFAPIEVYERDGWTCGLCQLPVDPGLPWPDPVSASVDHILPLSQGGSHTLANVQCAHLSCNSRKCDRFDLVQADGHQNDLAARSETSDGMDQESTQP